MKIATTQRCPSLVFELELLLADPSPQLTDSRIHALTRCIDGLQSILFGRFSDMIHNSETYNIIHAYDKIACHTKGHKQPRGLSELDYSSQRIGTVVWWPSNFSHPY